MKNDCLCCIFNIGAHYRFPIYEAMSKTLDCSFFLGEQGKIPVKTFDYKALSGFKKTLTNIFWGNFYWQRRSVRLLLQPYRYYLLDGEPYCLSSWIILLGAKILGKKTIAWTHGWYGRETLTKRILKKVFFSMFSRIMLYNEYALELMVNEGFPKNKLFCIANSLDSEKNASIREILRDSAIYVRHFSNSNPVAIYCGRIQKVKKIEELLRAIKLLKDAQVHINCILVGQDIDDSDLSSMIEELGISDQTWLYGACYDDLTLAELFYNSHVCVSPGNVGLTAIHALSFGCPVISHGNFPYQMPEFESIIPSITGDFFQQDNIQDLAEKIQKWCSYNCEKRRLIRSNAYRVIDEKWNIHYQLNTLQEVLNSLST